MAKRSQRYLFWQRIVMHPLQAVGAFAVIGLVRLLPLDFASSMGGGLARWIGPRLSLSKRAVRNLRNAFPDLSDEERARLLVDMWDNMGRTMFEYPHIDRLDIYGDTDRFEIVNRHIMDDVVAKGGPVVLIGGHLANWELMPLTVTQLGLPLTLVYRAPDNRWVDRLFLKRAESVGATILPKGRAAAKGALETLRSGGALGMLVDQKMNNGIAVPFFGRNAMTAPATAQFAVKFNCPIVPVRIERTSGAKFRVTFCPAITVPDSGNGASKALAIMTEVNRQIENWVRERPAQWLWVHNRWPD